MVRGAYANDRLALLQIVLDHVDLLMRQGNPPAKNYDQVGLGKYVEAGKAECCPVTFAKKNGNFKTVLTMEPVSKYGNRLGSLIIIRVLADEKNDVEFFILPR